MIVNILTLHESLHRRDALVPRLVEEGITYRFHYGEVDRMIPFRGISRSHKAIVQMAKYNNEPMSCIMEDDVLFTSPGSWRHFLDNIPNDFDIYLGGVSNGLLQEDNSVADFRGLFLYIIHERFYDTFLSLNEANNIDAELDRKGKYIVCNPFAVIHADGYSYHNKQHRHYGHLWAGRKLFGR